MRSIPAIVEELQREEVSGRLGSHTADIGKDVGQVFSCFDDFVNLLNVFLVVLDNAGVIVQVNKRGSQILGISRKYLVGKNWFDVALRKSDSRRLQNKFDEMMQTRYPEVQDFFMDNFENVVVTRKGDERVIRWQNTVVLSDDGFPRFVISSGLDVTKEKHVENDIRRSERKFRDIVELSPDGILTVDKKGFVTSVNSSFLRLTGFEEGEIVGKHMLRLPTLPVKRMPEFIGWYKKILRGSLEGPVDFIWRRKDGVERVGKATIGKIEHNGKIIGFQAILRDTTDEKKALDKVKESEERYQALFNNSMDLVYIYDFHGHFIDANDAAFNLLGYSKDDLENLNFSSLIDKKQLIKAYKLIREIKKHGYQFNPAEFRLKCKDGSFIYVETRSSLIVHDGKPIAIQGIARDITDRKQAEQALLQEKLLSDSILNSLPGVFYVFDKNGCFKRWNKNFELVTKLSANEFSKISPIDLFRGTDKKLVASRIQEVFTKGASHVEAELVTKDGKKIPYYFTGLRVMLQGENHVIGVGLDLSNLRAAESEIKKIDTKLQMIFKSSPSGIAIFDNDGDITSWSPACEELFGWSEKEVLGKPLVDIGLDTKFLEIIKKKNMNVEMQLKKQSGDFIEVSVSTAPLYDEGKNIVGSLAIFTDITQKKISETKLNEKVTELERYKRVTVGREMRIIKLKKEVNDLLKKFSKETKYFEPDMTDVELLEEI